MINKDELSESLAKTSKDLLLDEPFFGLFLMMLNKEWNRRLSTAAVSRNGINYQLTINDLFWGSLKPLWRKMIVKHELLHICFFHLERWDEFEDKDIANISADICVNQYIENSWLPMFDVSCRDYRKQYDSLIKDLSNKVKTKEITEEEALRKLDDVPPRGVYLQDFYELNLEPKQGIRYYYDKLMQAKGKKPGEDGFCQALHDMMQDKKDQIVRVIWGHDWSDFANMSEAEKKLMRSQADYILKEVADQVMKSRGTVPGHIADYIKGLDKEEPAKFNWKAYLRRFIGGSDQADILRTRSRYNIRYPQSPGRRIRPRSHVLIGVDTSGSMSSVELKEAFHEIYHAQKTGVEITVVQFDAGISNIKKYKKGLEDEIKLYGRGGTDFNDIVNYANEHSKDFSSAIIFTDGLAPAPENKCRLKTLWVHSSTSEINQSLQGFKIKLN